MNPGDYWFDGQQPPLAQGAGAGKGSWPIFLQCSSQFISVISAGSPGNAATLPTSPIFSYT